MKHKIIILIVLCISIPNFAQNKQFVGIGINTEFKSNSIMTPGFGISYENQIATHHGVEINLNYRSARLELRYTNVEQGANNLLFNVRENYLSIPVSYKIYSNIVNLSAGLTFDYFVNADIWTTEDTSIEVTDYTINPKMYMGCIFKIGKSFRLSDKLFIEPELYMNPIFKFNYTYYGASAKFKYKL